MKILIVKTSSFGDLIHTLPAVSDAKRALPDAQLDWVVDEVFTAVPRWHRDISKVIPVALRRWRKQPRRAFGGEFQAWLRQLRAEHYDYILDAQGLMKSAAITRLARGQRFGYADPREKMAVRAYHHRVTVANQCHGLVRVRELFAGALGYLPTADLDFGIDAERFAWPETVSAAAPYLLFAHGTTWPTKLWPEVYWRELALLAAQAGYRVLLPWGNDVERTRAECIAEGHANIERLPRLQLDEMVALLAHAAGVVAVDTGMAQLCGALGTLCISLWGPTNPELTGPVGRNQHYLRAEFPCAPCMARRCGYDGAAAVAPACFATLPPARVWSTLSRCLKRNPDNE